MYSLATKYTYVCKDSSIGFQTFLWLITAGISWLVTSSLVAQSIEWTTKGQAMVL